MPTKPVGDLAIDSLSSRFCYWQGSSGSRYLFSQIALDDIANFNNCILLLAIEQDGQPQTYWTGEISDLSPLTLRGLAPEEVSKLSAYVHLLAGCVEERKFVLSDLDRTSDHEACRLSA